MDASRFDAIIRLASQARTRRMALKTALGGAAALGLAGAIGEAEAKKKKKKCKKCKGRKLDDPCSTNKQCCTNETNRACAVPSNAGNSDLKCCGATDAKCDTSDDCCSGYSCEGSSCQPSPIEP